LFDRLNACLHDPDFIAAHRTRPSDFTRRRALPFHAVAAFLLNFVKGSLQTELDAFFAALMESTELVRQATKSAFSQARQKLRPSAFIALNQQLLQFVDEQAPATLWHGFRLLAADATSLRLPNCQQLQEVFGCSHGSGARSYVLAKTVGLFDVARKLMIHANLAPHASCERSLLLSLLDRTTSTDLLLLDRGYPAFWLFAALYQKPLQFCARIDNNGFAFVKRFNRSQENDAIVYMTPSTEAKQRCAKLNLPIQPIPLRLIRVHLPNGNTQILATSLLDQAQFPTHLFIDLYHQRWAIEECFKNLKCRLLIEQFCGESPRAIEQEFYAKLLASNLCAVLTHQAQQLLKPEKKQGYRINFAYALSACKYTIPRLLLGLASAATFHNLLALMAKTLERYRPNRSNPRKQAPIKPACHRAYKQPR